jgi:hypothetical protein
MTALAEAKMDQNKNTYQCAECGLHYQDEALSKQCEAWCKEHKSCNLSIAKESIEAQDSQDTDNGQA